MYLETLEALDEVSGIVLIDPDEAARRIRIEGADNLGIPCLRALAVMA